jgi:N-acetylmuramoyl-L-alanine amidase
MEVVNMVIKRQILGWALIYAIVLSGIWAIFVFGSKVVATMDQGEFPIKRGCVIIDAGHGGVDGGTTSCTGIAESHLNLEISLRLNDFLHFIGIDTKMIRTTDCSVYTSGETIAAKKVSDLKERVRMVETTENAILVSVHQNFFGQSIYSGAQVFYGKNTEGQNIARDLQKNLINTVNPGSKRSAKKASGVYLMEHVTCPAILIECGFLSNPQEEALLRSEAYQKKLCCVIGNTLSEFLNSSSSIT